MLALGSFVASYDIDNNPMYGTVLSVLQLIESRKDASHAPIYLHVQWFESLNKFMDAKPGMQDASTFQKMVPKEYDQFHKAMLPSNFPRNVLQPYFLMNEDDWVGTDIILAENVTQLVFMHNIPYFELPLQVRLYFLNTVISFESVDYAELILNDPYVKSILEKDWRVKVKKP